MIIPTNSAVVWHDKKMQNFGSTISSCALTHLYTLGIAILYS